MPSRANTSGLRNAVAQRAMMPAASNRGQESPAPALTPPATIQLHASALGAARLLFRLPGERKVF
jgi:hypothetical protein